MRPKVAFDTPGIDITRVYAREEAAQILGVSLSTLKRMIASGELQIYRPNGQRRVMILGASLWRLFGEPIPMPEAAK
ncbi:MAG: helix-turn-helix domain-containing protein [Chloroflexi bacterium]|nr:helix-turn-helix domain-containing protein [Chloroflexota bacterium]